MRIQEEEYGMNLLTDSLTGAASTEAETQPANGRSMSAAGKCRDTGMKNLGMRRSCPYMTDHSMHSRLAFSVFELLYLPRLKCMNFFTSNN
ncbi:MAG: hypothetical protein LBK97_04365 [Prevotellaceae bacterium]|nr:hypothetical protein [Prevotellaceae bacterium]